MGIQEVFSTPSPSATSQPQLITPPVIVPAPVSSVVPAAAMSASSRSTAPSSRSAEQSRPHQSPRHRPAPAQLAVTAPSTGGPRTHSLSRSWLRHPSGGWTHLPAVTSPGPSPITHPRASRIHGTRLLPVPLQLVGPV